MPRKKKGMMSKVAETGKKGGEAVVEKFEEVTHIGKNKRGRKKNR